jgi:hypothetical protein
MKKKKRPRIENTPSDEDIVTAMNLAQNIMRLGKQYKPNELMVAKNFVQMAYKRSSRIFLSKADCQRIVNLAMNKSSKW